MAHGVSQEVSQIDSYREGLKTQIKEACGRVVYTYTTHLKEAHIIKRKNAIIQWLLIVFSAVSTAGVLTAIFGGYPLIMSVISAVFTAISLALNLYARGAQLGEKAEKHRVISNALWPIREDYYSLLTDFETLEVDQIIKKRDSLQEKVNNVYCNAPLTSSKAYKLAQAALKNEQEQYFEPGEVDKLLPNHLRDGK